MVLARKMLSHYTDKGQDKLKKSSDNSAAKRLDLDAFEKVYLLAEYKCQFVTFVTERRTEDE